MATIYDVARAAAVSTATVSAVINKTSYVSPELTARVKQAIRDLDYTPNHLARAVQTRTSRTVGMLIPATSEPDPFYSEVVRGVEDVLRSKGYLLMLGHTYNRVEEQSRYLAAFQSRLVDGVLLFQAGGEDEELERMLAKGKPVVFVGRVPEGRSVDVVAADIQHGTYMGTSFLLEKGHRRVGLITVPSSLSVAAFRLAGWKEAHRRNRVAAPQELSIGAEMAMGSGRAAALRLLDLAVPPSAIFVDNLVTATGVIQALHERALVCPDEVEIVSSDDADWLDVFDPPITTVVQPSYELGVRAATVLLKRIRHNRRPVESIYLKPTLKIRESRHHHLGKTVSSVAS